VNFFYLDYDYYREWINDTCSTSDLPKLSTPENDYSLLLKHCSERENYYVRSSDIPENDCNTETSCSHECPCESINTAINMSIFGCNIYILGNDFHDENITVPQGYMLNISSENSENICTLTYFSDNEEPFFTIDFSELTIGSLTVIFGGSNKGAFIMMKEGLKKNIIESFVCIIIIYFNILDAGLVTINNILVKSEDTDTGASYPFITGKNVKYLVIKSVLFISVVLSGTKSSLISVNSGLNVTINNCTFKNITSQSNQAMIIDDRNSEIAENDFINISIDISDSLFTIIQVYFVNLF
jgi:hypothetical protein